MQNQWVLALASWTLFLLGCLLSRKLKSIDSGSWPPGVSSSFDFCKTSILNQWVLAAGLLDYVSRWSLFKHKPTSMDSGLMEFFL